VTLLPLLLLLLSTTITTTIPTTTPPTTSITIAATRLQQHNKATNVFVLPGFGFLFPLLLLL